MRGSLLVFRGVESIGEYPFCTPLPIEDASDRLLRARPSQHKGRFVAIRRSSQNWNIGETVRVGFLTLRVVGFTPTPGDYRPDVYTLESSKGIQYAFTPHYGLERLDTPAAVPPSNLSAAADGRLFRNE